MELNDLIYKKSEWLKGNGPKSNIVMSTRIRVARNLAGHPFFNWAGEKQRAETLNAMMAALKNVGFLKGALFLNIKDLSEVDRHFLVERHLMSKEHLSEVRDKGLVVGSEEMISLMLNEEDHIRFQVLHSGFDIMESWRIIDEIDNTLGKVFNFAYSNRFGYLTSCPTNTGTGLRCSVMLHLPALELVDQMGNVYEAVTKLGLTIRGFHGEGTEASGNFFQISNQVALGHSEMDIIDNLERVLNKIVKREEDVRAFLMKKKQQATMDSVYRAYGTLKSARIITSRETIRLLSLVRLGVDLGFIAETDIFTINEILLQMQPAHLQKINGRELSPQERDMKRADIIREKLGGDK